MFLCLFSQLENMPNKSTETLDARDEISNYLKEKGIMRKWLAKKLNLSNTHITLIFQKERELTAENRATINEILGTSF